MGRFLNRCRNVLFLRVWNSIPFAAQSFGPMAPISLPRHCVTSPLSRNPSTRRTRSEKESLSEGSDVMQGGKVDRLAVRFQDEGPDAGGNRTVIGKRESIEPAIVTSWYRTGHHRRRLGHGVPEARAGDR